MILVSCSFELKCFVGEVEPQRFVWLTSDFLKDHIFVTQLQCVCCRLADFRLVVRAQNLTSYLGLRRLNAEVLIDLAFICLLYTKRGDKVNRTIHHNQTIYFRILLPRHHCKAASGVLLVDSIYDTRANVTFCELILYLTENCLDSLQ